MAKMTRQFHVDLNADIGEVDGGPDEVLISLVSSVNIACGWHAGSPARMAQCVGWALRNRVAIGAHPSFFDRENFGRSDMQLPPQEVYAGLIYQIGALSAIATAQGARLAHVKPHGALYNMAADDASLADAVVAAVHDVDPDLALFGLAGSELIHAARRAGLRAVEEVFADRFYDGDGNLVKRGLPQAIIEDQEQAVQQVLSMVCQGRVKTVDGSWHEVRAETVCLHGDGPHAVTFAQAIRQHLIDEGIEVTARLAPQDNEEQISIFPLL